MDAFYEFEMFAAVMWHKDPASFEEGEREWMAFQKKLLRQTEAEGERLHMQRLIAMQLLSCAHDKLSTWEEFSRVLRRVQRLGYINVPHQLCVATITLLWMSRHAPDKLPEGWSMLEEAERRVLRTRLGRNLRDAGLGVIGLVKQRMSEKGFTPPWGTSPRQEP